MNHFQRGMQIGREFNLRAALRRRFETPARLAAELGIALDDIAGPTEKEFDMPNYHYANTHHSGADRRRARDQAEGENIVDYIVELLRDLDEEQSAELQARLAGDRGGRRDLMRRSARDEPEPFSGRPRPGGSMDPLDNVGTTNREMMQARDRARRLGHAHDAAPLSYREEREFDARFPSAKHIRLA
jgi:hypothetical protein